MSWHVEGRGCGYPSLVTEIAFEIFPSESTWEVPKEGFLSIQEQEQLTGKTSTTSHTASENQSTHTSQKSRNTVSGAPVTYGPAPKADAYSSWKSVM